MQKLFAFAVAALCLGVAGCATVKETHTADGRKAFTLNCSGTARGWDKCYSAAGDLCKAAGYDILDRTGESTASVGGSGGSFYGARSTDRTMIIACKTER